jgi:hypothetical protein
VNELALVGELLVWAVRASAQGYSEARHSARVKTLYQQLIVTYAPCTAEQLRADFKTKTVDTISSGKWLYLEPVVAEDDALPVMAVHCAIESGGSVRLRLRLGLFRSTIVSSATGEATTSKTEAVGYRFESPEDAVGPHSYYHVQRISAYDIDGTYGLPGAGNIWNPAGQPAFPLDTDNAVGLVLCLLVTLYGPGVVQQLIGQPFLNQIASCLENSCFAIKMLKDREAKAK